MFVCVENAGRSRMAEAFFNACAPAGWRATSAGTEPERTADPRTAPMLREVGADLPTYPPRRLTNDEIESAALRITMGCLDHASCPARLHALPVVDWALPDPAGLDDEGFRRVRDDIRERVASLVRELSRG